MMMERTTQSILCLAFILAAGNVSTKETICDSPTKALDTPQFDADVVFFGELHGNNESPRAFLAAICRYLEKKDSDVRVALEIGTGIQPSLDRFMASDGGSEAVQEFLRHPFWQRGVYSQDGRSSVAMLNLVEALRKLRASTHRLVSVTAIAGHRKDKHVRYFGASKSAIMAANINHLSRDSDDDVVLVLVGNLHARLTPPENMSDMTPAASLVEGDVASVLVLPESGESWNCQMDCQSWPVHEVANLSAVEDRVRTQGSYDYVLPIGRVSSSPPVAGLTNSAK